MVVKTNIAFENTVGELTVSLHLPVGLSFDTGLATLDAFKSALEEMAVKAKEAAEEAEKSAEKVNAELVSEECQDEAKCDS